MWMVVVRGTQTKLQDVTFEYPPHSNPEAGPSSCGEHDQ